MTYVKQIDDEKLKEHARESKRNRIEDGGFSHQRVGAHEKFYGDQKQVGQSSTNALPQRFNKGKGFNPKPKGGPDIQASPINLQQVWKALQGGMPSQF